jgi:hypothetical protein
MKKNLFKSVFAVIIGITGALLLTLNFWGSEWYKVVLSTLFGVVIGIFIADPYASLGIFAAVGKETWEKTRKFGLFMSTISERIEIYKLAHEDPFLKSCVGEEKKHWQKIYRRRKIAVPFYYFTRALPWLAFMFLVVTIMVTKYYHYGIIKTFLFLCGVFFISSAATFTFTFHGWKTIIGFNRIKKIFSAFPELVDYVDSFWDYGSYDGKDAVEDMTKFMNIVQVLFFIIFLDLFSFVWGCILLVRSIIVAILIIILAVIIFSTFSIPLLLLLLMKKIVANGFLLHISTSIVVGALAGTSIHSYASGIILGLGFLLFSFIVSFIEEISPFYFFKEGALIHKMEKYTF